MQTSVDQAMAGEKEGLAVRIGNVYSFVSGEALAFGLPVMRDATNPDDQVVLISALPASDVDGIMSDTAHSDAAATYTGTQLNGTIGEGQITPPQQLALVLNAHSDWDATTADVTGLSPDGTQVTETIPIPNNGNTTVYTATAFMAVESLYVPAQSGGGCSFTLGVRSTVSGLDRYLYPGIVMYDHAIEPYATGTEVPAGIMTNVLTHGTIWVVVEDGSVTAGMPAYVRITSSGDDVRGQFRGTPATNFVRYPNARFVSDQASADGLALLELF